MLRLEQCRDGLPPGRGALAGKNSGVKPAQALAVQGCVTSWEEELRG